MRIWIANLLWFLSCIPGYLTFVFSSLNPKRVQRQKLSEILKKNSDTYFGNNYHFSDIKSPLQYQKVPLLDYEDYSFYVEQIKKGGEKVLTKEEVNRLVPTSGSSSASKWIPYNASLKKEFLAGIAPWIVSLYKTYPSLFWGRHYWSISPSTVCKVDSVIPVGFDDDSEYLGTGMRFLVRSLFAVPSCLSQILDPYAFKYLTLLFLIREKNLRLVSVWHPSFFTLLIKEIPEMLDSIIHDVEGGSLCESLHVSLEQRSKLSQFLYRDPKRAKELRKVDLKVKDFPSVLWPNLKVISTWTDGQTENWILELNDFFPNAFIQGKGLTATEGIVSFPFGKSTGNVCAFRSHYFEFLEKDSEQVKTLGEIEKDKEYSVILTTSGGLYRYRLHDVVKVTGFFNKVPRLQFITRDNVVSDIVGEKLNVSHIEETIRKIQNDLDILFEFSMLAPYMNGAEVGYTFYLQHSEQREVDYKTVAELLSNELEQNFHYKHATKCSQLGPLKIFRILSGASEDYRSFHIREGKKMGEIKFSKLSMKTDWDKVFTGNYEF